jgi:hypothetical protein
MFWEGISQIDTWGECSRWPANHCHSQSLKGKIKAKVVLLLNQAPRHEDEL